MRHKNKVALLGRTTSHRKALLRNLVSALLLHKSIKTTVAKARETRRFAEKLITKAKRASLHDRRVAFRFLQNKEAVKILFDEVGPASADRPGGYTRILKLGNRLGDGAPMALLQLVDFADVVKKQAEKETKKTTKKDEKKAEKNEVKEEAEN